MKRYNAVIPLLVLQAAVAVVVSRVSAAEVQQIDVAAAAQRLGGAVRIKTVSVDDDPHFSDAQFLALHAYLEQQFPLFHQTLGREVINGRSLLFTWQGRDSTAKGILLMAHQDVVPVAPGTQADWTHDPFSGDVADGFVWGRGTWDDKGNLCAMMEAVELLIGSGFQPQRTIYLAFGHDEEAGTRAGVDGARAFAQLLGERNIHVEFVLDEGLLITHHMMDGLDAPVALIGVAEKGYLTLALTAQGKGGHSSMPPADTATARLAAALTRLEAHQMPASLPPIAREMLSTVAPDVRGPKHLALSNLWLFAPLVRMQLEKQPATNAMVRTTTAITVMRAGNKEQVIPGKAQAWVNFRLLPGDTAKGVLQHTRDAIGDPSILVEPSGPSWEPSPVSRTDTPAFHQLSATIREVFPGTRVAPGLMVGATDSRRMTGIADNVFRFTPVHAAPEDLARFHGTNERVSLENYADMIRFFRQVIINSTGQR